MHVKSLHHLSFFTLNSGDEVPLSVFKGKKMLLVNVASRCGFTYQYKELQELYEKNKESLVIIGFPCNQFFFQETGSDEKIANFCSVKYGVTFPMSTKVKVKGRNQDPVYEWLTSKGKNGVGDFKVSWNFNKFLINEEGELVAHFGSEVKPMSAELTKLIV